MTVLLPFIEHDDIYQAMDLTKSYRDTTAGQTVPGTTGGTATVDSAAVKGNVWAATRHISTYVCPSNPFGDPEMRDPAGFGGTDYFATVYTDIDPDPASTTYGGRNKATAHGRRPDGRHRDIRNDRHRRHHRRTDPDKRRLGHHQRALSASATAPATPSP